MKAILRTTGEIVDIISFNGSAIRTQLDFVSYIDSKGVEHDRESLNYYWDFARLDTEDEDRDAAHWQEVRERAAIAALQGLSSNPELIYSNGQERIVIAARAARYADELVKALKSKES